MPKKPTSRAASRKDSGYQEAKHFDPYLSLYEASEYTGYHWQTLRKEILLRNLISSRGPGLRSSHKIRLSELNRWMASREGKRSKVLL